MTKDEIIEMARNADFYADNQTQKTGEWNAIRDLCFAALVATKAAAKEREACAQVCEQAINSIWDYAPEEVQRTGRNVCNNLAKAIRARSTT